MVLNDINDDDYVLKRYMVDTYDIYISPTIFYFDDNITFTTKAGAPRTRQYIKVLNRTN